MVFPPEKYDFLDNPHTRKLGKWTKMSQSRAIGGTNALLGVTSDEKVTLRIRCVSLLGITTTTQTTTPTTTPPTRAPMPTAMITIPSTTLTYVRPRSCNIFITGFPSEHDKFLNGVYTRTSNGYSRPGLPKITDFLRHFERNYI